MASCVCSRDGGGAVLRIVPEIAAAGAETLSVVALATATTAVDSAVHELNAEVRENDKKDAETKRATRIRELRTSEE